MTPDALELLIVPRARDLGDGFMVQRALPAPKRMMVGPFIFFDQMGPNLLAPGVGLDVRPHPHIGLATVTYLFEGALLHRDSLGTVQRIEPGAVNWMTAGRGIVHSERTPPTERSAGGPVFGIQSWVALPKNSEESAPSFVHTPASSLPVLSDAGVSVRVIAGEAFGLRSPVATSSPTLYADVSLEPGARLAVEGTYVDRAAYVVDGSIELDGVRFNRSELLVFRPGEQVVLAAPEKSRVLLLGGEPMDGPRHIVWNFVSSSARRIADAKEDWKAQRFPRVPDETEFIPLPERLPSPVDYP